MTQEQLLEIMGLIDKQKGLIASLTKVADRLTTHVLRIDSEVKELRQAVRRLKER